LKKQVLGISMPAVLVAMIDIISKQKGMSGSRFISTVLHEKGLKNKKAKNCFSTKKILVI